MEEGHFRKIVAEHLLPMFSRAEIEEDAHPVNRAHESVAGRAKTSQRGALKTGQCFDDAYTSSV